MKNIKQPLLNTNSEYKTFAQTTNQRKFAGYDETNNRPSIVSTGTFQKYLLCKIFILLIFVSLLTACSSTDFFNNISASEVSSSFEFSGEKSLMQGAVDETKISLGDYTIDELIEPKYFTFDPMELNGEKWYLTSGGGKTRRAAFTYSGVTIEFFSIKQSKNLFVTGNFQVLTPCRHFRGSWVLLTLKIEMSVEGPRPGESDACAGMYESWLYNALNGSFIIYFTGKAFELFSDSFRLHFSNKKPSEPKLLQQSTFHLFQRGYESQPRPDAGSVKLKDGTLVGSASIWGLAGPGPGCYNFGSKYWCSGLTVTLNGTDYKNNSKMHWSSFEKELHFTANELKPGKSVEIKLGHLRFKITIQSVFIKTIDGFPNYDLDSLEVRIDVKAKR